jgi:hypothetical protein
VLRAAFSLALSAVVVFATASVVVRLVSDERIPSGTRVTGLAWGDRVFTSKQEFAEFLGARGVAYEEWASRHPGAAPWQRSSTPARADGADGGEATARGAPQPAESAAPAKSAAPETTASAGRRSSPSAAAPSSPGDGLASRLAPAALLLALVTLLLMAARRVGLRPAVVPVTAAGPALDRPRERRPSPPMRPQVSTAKASVAVATATPTPRAEAVDIPAPDAATEPGRRLGVRLRGLVPATATAMRSALTSVAGLLAAFRALLARAVAATRAGALERKREAAHRGTSAWMRMATSIARLPATVRLPLVRAVAAAAAGTFVRKREAAARSTPSARARIARAGVTLAGLATRAGATVARATVAGVESVRWFLRGRSVNALDVATYSLAIVAAAGIGVVIAFVAGR